MRHFFQITFLTATDISGSFLCQFDASSSTLQNDVSSDVRLSAFSCNQNAVTGGVTDFVAPDLRSALVDHNIIFLFDTISAIEIVSIIILNLSDRPVNFDAIFE